MRLSSEALNILVEQIEARGIFATTRSLDIAVQDLLNRTEKRESQRRGAAFSLSRMIRGLRAMRGEALVSDSAEDDVRYCKALATGTTPGSYLVPTIQAEEIIEYLTIGGVFRGAGVRIWPMEKIQKLNVPVATGLPTWEWLGQNTAQTPTDPNLGQMPFDLKERRALIAVPNQLLVVSVPAFDTLLAELIGLGAAEHEDDAVFSSTTVSGGPTCLMQTPNISTINAGNNSANGGNLTYADLLSVLAKASSVKAKPPFIWFFSPRTWYNRVLGLTDANSRPIVFPVATQGLFQGAPPVGQFYVGQLLGWPAYITPAISESESVGSGSSQSHCIFTNPRYCHIAQSGNIEVAISTERYFEVNQTAIRGTMHEDLGFQPAAGIVVLSGIN